jgi:membrane protease YdiL (CAAX protease family)
MGDMAPPDKPDPLTPGGAVLLTLIAFSGFMTVGLVAQMLKSDAIGDPVIGLAAFIIGPLIALFVGLYRYAPDEGTAVALGLARRPRVLPLLLAVVAGAAAGLPLDEVVLRMYQWFPHEVRAAAGAQGGTAWRGTQATMAIGLIVAIPLVYELLYRGLVQPRLVPRMGALGAIGTAALLHVLGLFMNPHALPSLVAIAILAGVAAWADGVWAAIALHVAARSARVVVDLAGFAVPGPGPDGAVVHLSPAAVAACAAVVVVAAAALIGIGRTRQAA